MRISDWSSDVCSYDLRKVYVYQYRIARPGEAERTPARRYTIGRHGNLTPAQARKRAKELAELVERGICPKEKEKTDRAADEEAKQQARQKARLAGELVFEKVAALWLEHYENEKIGRANV